MVNKALSTCWFSVAILFFGCTNAAFNRQRGVCIVEIPTADLISDEDRNRLPTPVGNGTRPGYTTLDLCCIGYTRDRTNTCVPECEGGCENGNCVAPNQCVCQQNFIEVEGNCIPTCPRGCFNGACRGNTCICNYGHELDESGRFCRPICLEGCGPGGLCTGPGVCTCKNGTTRNPSTGQCEYFCADGCTGGICTAPNVCTCNYGYHKQGNICVPECTRGCRNGLCTGPNQCTCRAGLTLDASGTICMEPYNAPHRPAPSAPTLPPNLSSGGSGVCDMPCYNGECTGRNSCTCRNGYIKDPNNSSAWNRCVAHCPGGCENGVCSAPNFCICNAGFMKEGRGSNRCIRRA